MVLAQEHRAIALWTTDENGFRSLTVPVFEFQRLGEDEQRFFILQPADDQTSHVRCHLDVSPFFEAPPYIAVKNARGYRLLEDPIEVDGNGMIISAGLERFLRHYRSTITKPTRLWVRHLCVDQQDARERTSFWTRDWSDTMYAMATEVVDMSAFNADLIDRGKVQQVHDSRYSRWTKEWYGGLETVTLPKVYPIRPGSVMRNSRIEAPVAEYQYSPLDLVAKEIRIIVLVPSVDVTAPIVLDLAHCPMRCEVNYAALSYRWGVNDEEGMITLNGQRKYVRKNLEEALRSIRHKECLQPLWIDTISINQEDLPERSRQVPPSDDSDLALQLIRELQQPMIRLNPDGEWYFGQWSYNPGNGPTFGENHIKPPQLARMCAALYKFVTRPYFRHSWVLQENAFASNPTIGIGTNYDTKFDQLDMAAYNFESILGNDPSMSTYMAFTKAWIAQHSNLDIVGAVEAYGSESFYADAPSWCPDWSTPSTASCLIRRERIPNILMMAINSLDGVLYSADGGIEQAAFDEPLFYFDEDVLCCTGILLDQVQFVLKDAPEMPDGTLVPFSSDPYVFHKFQTWTKELDDHFSTNGIMTYKDNMQAATAMMHGDCTAAWPPRDENPENCSELHPGEKYVSIRQDSRHIRRYGSEYDRSDAWTTVKTVLRGRRPFVTDSGYMGLLPSYTSVSDKPWHLAIFAGCSVPLLLREQDDGIYKISGT
ncbi:hypothetical protein CLAFUW4_03548 [Fulvia fulva]|nr:hypothetical protein CLAFUR4_03537 [Fulvia fulva]KAK4633609.1 hypothetical protein CLAFUR0_03542 [Fulvia fulva]WPV11872.1 hypothetical protein CLAFUW4_03548 [Fulvia fulva]WPV26114.1 hypothetical protein CLAFUW7_03540 [Fulvia fulva]